MEPLRPFYYKEFVYEMRLLEKKLEKKLAAQRAKQEAEEKANQKKEEERRESIRTGVKPPPDPKEKISKDELQSKGHALTEELI